MAQSRPKRRRYSRPKTCRPCEDKITDQIHFKNTDLLRRYVTEKGKIIPRRITGNCVYCQRKFTAAIRRARNLALI